MPTYRYTCETCKQETDLLVIPKVRDSQVCRTCGNILIRKGSGGFSVNTPLDTSKKDAYSNSEIDKVIGASASKKWDKLHKKIDEKLAGPNVVTVDIKPGQPFNPEHLLGDSARKERAAMYSKHVKDTPSETLGLEKSGFKRVFI